MNIIIGNILSLVSNIFLGISTHRKSRQEMILFQIFDCIFAIISCLVLNGISGASANIVALIRNICAYFKKDNKYLTFIFIIFLLSIGYYDFKKSSNNYIVFLPVIASIEYTITIMVCKQYILCKYSLLVNQFIWMIYCIFIHDYVGVITLVIISISTIISILHNKDDMADSGLTKHQREKIKFKINRIKKD